jgi:hypothetical protein
MLELPTMLTIFWLALSLTLTAQPGAPQSRIEEFTRLERQWMDALAAKDEAALQKIVAPEFTIVGAGSTPDDMVTDRASWMRVALLRQFPKHEVTNLRVTRVSDVAIVQCVLTGTYPPKSLTQEGGTLTFLTTDVWANRSGAWQVISRHSSLAQPPVSR